MCIGLYIDTERKQMATIGKSKGHVVFTVLLFQFFCKFEIFQNEKLREKSLGTIHIQSQPATQTPFINPGNSLTPPQAVATDRSKREMPDSPIQRGTQERLTRKLLKT